VKCSIHLILLADLNVLDILQFTHTSSNLLLVIFQSCRPDSQKIYFTPGVTKVRRVAECASWSFAE
jgi:hypothetical protein